MTIPICFDLPFLLLVLVLPSLSTAKNAGMANINHTRDCDTLLQFSNSFNTSEPVPITFEYSTPTSSESVSSAFDSYPKTATWKNGTDCCSWDGVTCHVATNRVDGLKLSFSWLVGPLDSNSPLFSLRNLRRLDLAGNDFKGSLISPRFGNFTRMTHLNLSQSGFSGRIPLESISRLSSLITLDLSSSQFYWPYDYNLTVEDHSLERFLCNLTRLRELKLDYVDMSKISPILLSNLSSTLTSLSLYECNLQGTFPTDLFRLPNLRSLSLSQNKNLRGTLPATNWTSPLVSLDLSYTMFNESIPASLGNMVHMNHLDLSNSKFSGVVDLEMLANLRNLRHLSLGRCDLTVLVRSGGSCCFPEMQFLDLSACKLTEFPYFLSSSDALSLLDLSNNTVSGRIPEWFHTDELEYLNLSYNEFTGDIPSSTICRASSLKRLLLSNNELTGTIPECFGNLSRLVFMHLSDNLLQGPLPRTLSNCTSLEYFLVGQNRIHDTFPHWLINKNTNGIKIDLRSNMFHGVIDAPISRGFFEINLADNNFSGQLPANFILNSWIGFIDVGSNNFDGPLPIPPPNIQLYIVSKNKFDGAIPHQLCYANQLSILDLSGNRLTGSIPSCFSDLVGAMLSVMDLRGNNLYGQIPEIFLPRGSSLQTLRLSQNRLVGSLPRSLDRCKNLTVLDLSENELEGDFPYWLDTLPNLQVLVLRSNKFHGPVNISRRTDRPFSKLRIFDIAKNGFWGPLPAEYLAKLVAMKNEETGGLEYIGNHRYYQDSIVVEMKGLEMELVKILTIFTTIDFSSNYFHGEIPEVIGDLKALKGLNFSHNNLSGNIPSSFGNLTNLEWLDLSSNNLNGKIPRELADLKMLSWLNLSNNHLTGPIPQSTQFDTFNNSFDGNPGLCGRPLPKPCENDATPSTPTHDEEEEAESDSIRIEWRAVPMGYVCGLVFGISATYLMLETGRPRRLARMVHRKINSLRMNMPRRNVASRNYARRRTGGQ